MKMEINVIKIMILSDNVVDMATPQPSIYVGRLWRAIQKVTLSLHTRLPCHNIHT